MNINTAHILHEGHALCGTMRGAPNTWPDGNVWVSVYQSPDANCKSCIDELNRLKGNAMEQTELNVEDKRGRKGRKTGDGTAETIKFQPIKDACKEMMKSYKKFQSAKEDFDSCISGVAERSNSNVTTLKKLVKASAKGNFTDVRHKIDQESVIFETVGEIGGNTSGE